MAADPQFGWFVAPIDLRLGHILEFRREVGSLFGWVAECTRRGFSWWSHLIVIGQPGWPRIGSGARDGSVRQRRQIVGTASDLGVARNGQDLWMGRACFLFGVAVLVEADASPL